MEAGKWNIGIQNEISRRILFRGSITTKKEHEGSVTRLKQVSCCCQNSKQGHKKWEGGYDWKGSSINARLYFEVLETDVSNEKRRAKRMIKT
jgi:hypothetical protein